MKKIFQLLKFIPLLNRIHAIKKHRDDLFKENNLLKAEISKFYEDTVVVLDDLFSKICISDIKVDSEGSFKVLHIAAADYGGGGNLLAMELHRGLLKVGVDSKVIVADKKTDDPNVSSFLDAGKDKSWYNRVAYEAKRRGLIDLFNLESFQLINHSWINDADIIHIHNIHGDFFSWFLLPLICKGKKVVWTLHDMYPFTGHCAYSFECFKWQDDCNCCERLDIYPGILVDRSKKLLAIKKRIFEEIKPMFVCPSDWQYNNARQSIGKDFALSRIYNGVDVEVYKKQNKKYLRKDLKLALDKKILIYIGNMGIDNPFKGTEFIGKLVSWVQLKDDYLFLIVGGNLDKIEGNVQYISYKSEKNEIAKYLSASNVFIMPSLQEVFGLVAAESMACGTPVVGFNTGGISEIIEHEKSGYLSKYRDFEDLIHGVEYICNLELEGYEKMCDEAVSRVKENFDKEIMIDNYIKYYKLG